jgi:replicative DNA helicase Mcm
MATAATDELVERFEQFFRDYYRDDIGDLARRFPTDQRSLYVDWRDLYRFDPDLADDYLSHPTDFREQAEEALRLYDLPVDVKLGGAHVRLCNLPETTPIRDIRSRHVNTLIAVNGLVRKATDVKPKIRDAAFECQRCGTLTRVPQTGTSFQEPHECQGCERQGPFRLNVDQSEFVDSQSLRIQESPEGLQGGETPRSIDVRIEDDLTGKVTPGDQVTVTGVLRIDQSDDGDGSAVFDTYMEGVTLQVEDEEFEDMEITDEDKREIVRLSDTEDLYDRMIGSIAPSIFGYDQQKLAMALQLFSGVTKKLPDGTRLRGDLHVLFIGDPGTGKCVAGDTEVTLSDGSRVPIERLVERRLTDPVEIDDGYYQEADIRLPTLRDDGSLGPGRATKVYKREAPDRLYRIRTTGGKQVDVTPSHPLFVPTGDPDEDEDRNGDGDRTGNWDDDSGDGFVPRNAERLREGSVVAVAAENRGSVVADGGAISRAEPASDHAGSPTVACERIESMEAVEPDDDQVYDLEVAGTHSYLSNGIVSHNSQMLQYVKQLSPRSVYASGKGSSSAGLCVTGDTLVYTAQGPRRIGDLAAEKHPAPVDEETPAPFRRELYTYDRSTGQFRPATSSLIWRMPERPCCRIETADGRHLEASTDTPVLTRVENGNESGEGDGNGGGDRDECEWTPIAEVEPGDLVAVPQYDQIDPDREPSPRSDSATPTDQPQADVETDGGVRASPMSSSDPDTGPDGNDPTDVRWDRVVSTADAGEREVFDLTVPGTHNFVGNGVVTHNTAAAVKDDFGDGQQWSLEAGALVLADRGIAAVDELDKMRCVAGGTLVRRGDGSTRRIRDVAESAADAAVDGDVERLTNGRTIRDPDLTAQTTTDDGRVVSRPVTAVHEYDAPEHLYRVTLESGESVAATADHPFFVADGNGTRAERAAEDLTEGDRVLVPLLPDGRSVETDGGVSSACPGSDPDVDPAPSPVGRDVTARRVASVERVVPTPARQDDSEDHELTPKVYDLTVEGTHNFLANGMVVHNSEDRSAMHQALEQQEISISKAGINATLKSRCSLLGAANPKYGRFDQYEAIGEQIDLEPALISRFDLIFTVTDQPDEQKDSRLAEHILTTNYAGELTTQRREMTSPDVPREEVESYAEEIDPAIPPDLFRKYVAYAKQNCHPRMTEAARERIKTFYTDLRAEGTDVDAPVPVTARKLEAIIRLAEASARLRLSDEVSVEDADRVIEIVRSCLQDVGIDPESGDFDADIVETGTSKSQRERIKNVRSLIADIEEEYDSGAPVEVVLDRAEEVGMDASKAEHEIEKLKQQGEVYEPSTDHLRTT